MNLTELNTLLQTYPNKAITFALPSGEHIAPHFHITDIAHINKHFIDCGGTEREEQFYSFQVWLAEDVEHRVDTSKLATIIEQCKKILLNNTFDVQIEYQYHSLSQYAIESFRTTDKSLVIQLASINTLCLAKDTCGSAASSSDSRCCA